MHSVEEALAAVRIAASIFERHSFDLIYARPGQTPQAWGAELEQAIGHAVEHLSLYQLTIEPGTWFERLHAAGKIAVPDEETGRALYDVTQEVCEKHGLPAYEISNHARPGAESRHNLLYWRYGEYAGIGPGAHGRLVTGNARLATSTEKHPETWLERVERDGHGIVEEEVLTAEAEGDEFLLMGLRLKEGIAEEGLIRLDGARLAVTPKGFPVLNAVIAELAA
jgi:oxygen-independent coproporphyrinogen-3 oxidase